MTSRRCGQLVVARLPEFTEEDVTVPEWSTIRIRHNFVLGALATHRATLRVRLFEDRIEVWFTDKPELSCERLRGRNQRRADYRHHDLVADLKAWRLRAVRLS
ncbi:MAG: hypothetical protein IPG04_34805 [Polyangiaceae bacterium]|nr:hypothetical protein [Polyangiaceae bacterium]